MVNQKRKRLLQIRHLSILPNRLKHYRCYLYADGDAGGGWDVERGGIAVAVADARTLEGVGMDGAIAVVGIVVDLLEGRFGSRVGAVEGEWVCCVHLQNHAIVGYETQRRRGMESGVQDCPSS